MAKRPNILKLATKISLESMTYTGITYNDPEYKILEPIIDDEMCAIMMHLRLEANRTVEDVAKRAKQSVEYTQTQLDKLAKTGAVRYRYVDGKRCYFYPIWVPGIMEGILANREQCDKYPVLGESFEAYTRRRPEMLAPMLDSGKTGIELIQQTLTGQLGTWTNAFMSVTVLFFAFSSIIGNYFYGEINMDFISRHPAALWIYRAFVVMMVYLGSVASLGLVWNLADLFMALMAIVNLVAIAILGKYAFIALDDYVSQKKRGILNPEFDPSVMPNHRGILCWPRHKEEEIEQC